MGSEKWALCSVNVVTNKPTDRTYFTFCNTTNKLYGAESFMSSWKYSQLLKTFPIFNETRMFITVFTTARILSLSWARLIQSQETVSCRLSYYPFPVPRIFVWSLPLRLTNQNFVRISHITSVCQIFPPTHHIVLDLIALEYLVNCAVSYYAVSSLFDRDIPLRTLFLQKPSTCSSFNARGQVLHPYKTTGKIIISRVVIYTFSGSWPENEPWQY